MNKEKLVIYEGHKISRNGLIYLEPRLEPIIDKGIEQNDIVGQRTLWGDVLIFSAHAPENHNGDAFAIIGTRDETQAIDKGKGVNKI